jgi:hypothetical protein
MKETGRALEESNEDATNSSGFTGLREGIVTAMGRSTALAATVTGGVLRMPILHTPGILFYYYGPSADPTPISLSVSQCVASELIPLSL